MGALAGSIDDIVTFGLDDRYFDTYAGQDPGADRETVTAAAAQTVQPDHLVWIIVGDRAKIEAPLRELGLGEFHIPRRRRQSGAHLMRRESWRVAAADPDSLPGVAAAQHAAASAFIQGPIEAGLRGGRDFENHAWSLGGLARMPVGTTIELRPSGDVFFPKDGKTGWQANGDAAIPFGPGGTVYGGGGIAFVHLNGDKTRTGYNLFFGLIPRPARGRYQAVPRVPLDLRRTTPVRSAWLWDSRAGSDEEALRAVTTPAQPTTSASTPHSSRSSPRVGPDAPAP